MMVRLIMHTFKVLINFIIITLILNFSDKDIFYRPFMDKTVFLTDYFNEPSVI